MWSGLTVGTITHAVGHLRRVAAVPADDADHGRADFVARTASAVTRFGLTFFSRLPPPTESTRIRSSGFSRLTRSHSTKTVAQPSSLVRAVSSETLSVGAYASMPAILRKSLTAWEALAALPPTPRMNSRPPRSRAAPGASPSFDGLGVQAVDHLLGLGQELCRV